MGRWVRFPNFVIPYPVCGPSRGVCFTGQTSWHSGVDQNQNSWLNYQVYGQPGFYRALKDAGVSTGMIGKFINGYTPGSGTQPSGWTYGWITGDSDYYSYSVNYHDSPGPNTILSYGAAESDYATDQTASHAAEFIDLYGDPAGPPIFGWVAPQAPHGPWTPAVRYQTASVDPAPFLNVDTQSDVSTQPAWIQAITAVTTAQANAVIANRRKARRCMLNIDDLMEDVFDALAAKGILEQTIVIRLTDNGTVWGRYKRLGKTDAGLVKGFPYPEVVQASACVWWGDDVEVGVQPNVVVIFTDDETYGDQDALTWPWLTAQLAAGPTTTRTELVTTLDMTAMIYRLYGVEPTVPGDGIDMTPLCLGLDVPWRDNVDIWNETEIEKPNWSALWREDPASSDAWARRPIFVSWASWSTTNAVNAGGPFAAEEEFYPSLTTSGASADGERPTCTVNEIDNPAYATVIAEMRAALTAKRAQTDGEALAAGRPRDHTGAKVPWRVAYDGILVEARVTVAA